MYFHDQSDDEKAFTVNSDLCVFVIKVMMKRHLISTVICVFSWSKWWKSILCIPSVNTKSYDERSFSLFAPTLWNTLPKHMLSDFPSQPHPLKQHWSVCVVRVCVHMCLIQGVYCTCILCIVNVNNCKAIWALVRKGAQEMLVIIIIISCQQWFVLSSRCSHDCISDPCPARLPSVDGEWGQLDTVRVCREKWPRQDCQISGVQNCLFREYWLTDWLKNFNRRSSSHGYHGSKQSIQAVPI